MESVKTDDLKTIVLKTFKDKPFYGYEAHKSLLSLGMEMDISRLYKVLNKMLNEGLLESRWERSQQGPRMRVYRLGEKGRKELDRVFGDAIAIVHYFYSEYLLGLTSEKNVFTMICKLLSSELKGKNNIVYVTSQYSIVNERVLLGLHSETPEAKIYIVKPSLLTVDLNLGNVALLDGSFTYIPLRDGYADLVVVSGLPEEGHMEKALREWRRALKKSGKLAIVVPTINVKEYRDPLDIGDFIERYEKEAAGKGDYIDRELIARELKNCFQRVEEEQIVHLTVFLASEAK